MAVDARESEIKYELPAGAPLPRFGDLPQVAGISGPDDQDLVAEYYDTSDLRLLRAGITLRRRQGGTDPGWHLKLPDTGTGGKLPEGASTRREIRLPPGPDGTQVPRELAELVRVHTRAEPLRPVARVATKRRRLVLLGEAGDSLAEVAADEVSAQTMGESATLSRWREVELELTGGDWRLLRAADEVLRRDGLLPAGWSAKLERALSGQRPGPVRPAPVRLTASSPAGDVVLAYLRAQVAALKALDPMVRTDVPDSIHQMRVTTRRVRSALRSFTAFLRPATAGHLRAELRWLADVLGAARDAEVLASHLRRELDRLPAELLIGPAQARVQAHFSRLRARARAKLLTALDSGRYFTLLDGLDELTAEPPLTDAAARAAAEVLPATVRGAYRRTRRRVNRARRAEPGQARDAAFHQARKAARRARYVAEAVTPAVGKDARRFARKMKGIQSVLGDHQDAVIAGAAARELGISAHLAGENAFSYGLVHQREAQSAGRLQRRTLKVWKRASRSRYRRWLRKAAPQPASPAGR